MPASPRLREHYFTFGPDPFGPVELLALVIGTGSAGTSARQIASRLVDTFGTLEGIRRAPVAALAHIKGMGPARAVRVHAALHLSVRSTHVVEPPCIDEPGKLVHFLQDRLEQEPTETFWVVGLSSALRVVGCRLVSRGSRRCTVVDPAEVFRHAVQARMDSIVVAHNHPSGNPTPSTEDHALTQRLARCGQLLGIPVVDHVVIGQGTHWSFRAHGAMPGAKDLRGFTGAADGTPFRWCASPHASPG